ncbi:MAG: hypothetical protein QOF41_2199 [Methylobacteriaceae bacterium]|nr:hypothetical protein [Methylobacteriaceae bacterium]
MRSSRVHQLGVDTRVETSDKIRNDSGAISDLQLLQTVPLLRVCSHSGMHIYSPGFFTDSLLGS